MHTYLISLGDFDTMGYANRDTKAVWVLFFLASFAVQVIFMNMLIAIMSESYDTVKSQ